MNAEMAEGSAAETPANGERKELGFLRPVWQMKQTTQNNANKKNRWGGGWGANMKRFAIQVNQSSKIQVEGKPLSAFFPFSLWVDSGWNRKTVLGTKRKKECPPAIHVRQWRHIVCFDTDSMFSRLKLHYCKETLLALANRTTSMHRRQGSSLSIPAKPLFPSPSHHQVLKQRSIGKTWRQRQIKRRSRSACGACALKIETCAKTPSLFVTLQTLPEKKMEPTERCGRGMRWRTPHR